MKHTFRIACALAVMTYACIAAEVTDPVQDYFRSRRSAPPRMVLRWEVDLKNDGRKEVLLDVKQTPEDVDREEREAKGNYNTDVRSFSVYIPDSNGAGYIESKGVDDGSGLGLGVAPDVNITQCYIGQITQLKKWGLVTVQNDDATDECPATAYIYAYTVEGDHLKRQLLAKYNPTQGANAIYNQYLSASKRTNVQLQEVTP